MRNRPLSFVSIVLLAISLTSQLPIPATSQVRPVNDYGELGFQQAIRRLNTTASVMMIGAHPDDEDSGLLAYLARGESARTAYLSLTRGDGGQNIIGPELFEALGVIRTEELLQARRLDGASQYFTRAFDYGFSKTLDEAKQKWPVDVIKCDMVRAIREFKPQVVISVWSGTPGDGHGQHQYSGYISPIAVAAAADTSQCQDAGTAWQVQKSYVERGSSSQPTLRINVGKYDSLLGRSYFELAMEGRSQHRSQGEGRLELRGDQFSTLNYVSGTVPKGASETSVFDGIETRPPWGQVSPTANLNDLVGLTSRVPENSFARKDLNEAIAHLAGIQIDALADRETAVPGESLGVGIKIYLHGLPNASIKDITLTSPVDWQVTAAQPPGESSTAFNRRENADLAGYYVVKIPVTAQPTEPYWLEADRLGDMFSWQDDSRRTLPFGQPPLSARVRVRFGLKELVFEKPVEFRFADSARGEIRREFNVVPQLSVSLDKMVLIVPASNRETVRRVVMTVGNDSSGPVNGKAHLTLKGGAEIKVVPDSADVTLRSKGEKLNVPFDVTIPAGTKAGSYVLIGGVFTEENHNTKEMQIVSYPHIQTHRYYTWAQPKVDVLDLKVAAVNVGYIMGSGDDVPDAIREMGMNVTLLDEKALASGDLSKYDTIVVGIRASETRPDFVANNKRLLDYVNAGGNLIVQYQRGNFANSGLLPYPADAQDKQRTAAGSIARVVDENAPVQILQPQNPIFNFPNKITEDDFKGWVQERNAYNLVTFDSKYTPLLESHDVGEQPNNGGMVLANLGKGTYIYTSYSWFRQLPAGVPGAYRIFANLLSLPKAAVKKP